MRIILFILRKEFIQIFRNKGMLPIIFIIPLIQLLVLAHAATYDIKNINFSIIDNDKSSLSLNLFSKFQASKYYTFRQTGKNIDIDNIFKNSDTDMIITINNGFENNIIRNEIANINLSINAINSAKAGVIGAYSNNIINDFLEENNIVKNKPINIIPINFFNRELDYKTFMVPGILVLLVSVIGLFLTGLNIAREKEMGTIDQLNVTPINKFQFIIGKLMPFMLISIFELSFGLFLAKNLYSIPIEGSYLTILIFAIVYMFSILSVGLFISTLAETQHQSMLISFFVMLIFIFLSGLFTPISSMPDWAQILTKFIPLSYFIEVMRAVMLKGSAFADLYSQFFSLTVYGIVAMSIAVFRYKKTN